MMVRHAANAGPAGWPIARDHGSRLACCHDPGPGTDQPRKELPAIDTLPTTIATPHPDLDSLLGVAGADFGNAIHRILELRVPGEPLAAQHALVRESLTHYDVSHRELTTEALAARLIPRLQAVLDADLARAGVRLADLPSPALRAEMEFDAEA